MIARLRGRLWVKQPDHLVLDCGGVGYRVLVPLSTFYDLPEPGGEVELMVRTHVTSDSITLFGFLTPAERGLFDLLITVTGIGPKLGLNILSGIQPPDLSRALALGDVKRLMAIPGVGRKLAERLVVELKDKAGLMAAPAGQAPTPPAATGAPRPDVSADAVSAMTNLGYNPLQAERAVAQALSRFATPPGLEELLKEALRGLAR